MSGKVKCSIAVGIDKRCWWVSREGDCQGRLSRGVFLLGFWRMNRSLPIEYSLSIDRQGREKHSRRKEQHLWRKWGVKTSWCVAFTHQSMGQKQFLIDLPLGFSLPVISKRGCISEFLGELYRSTGKAVFQACFLSVDWLLVVAMTRHSAILRYFVETDITVVPAASLGHAIALALSQNCSRSWETCISSSPHPQPTSRKHENEAQEGRSVQGSHILRPVCVSPPSNVTLRRDLLSLSLFP